MRISQQPTLFLLQLDRAPLSFDDREHLEPAYVGPRIAGQNRHWVSDMDSGPDLIRQEWQQKKKDVEKKLADLRHWMRAHQDDESGHTDATKELITRLEGELAELDKLLAGELPRP